MFSPLLALWEKNSLPPRWVIIVELYKGIGVFVPSSHSSFGDKVTWLPPSSHQESAWGNWLLPSLMDESRTVQALMSEQIWETNWTILNTTNYMAKKKQNAMAVHRAAEMEEQGGRTRPCLLHPDERLPIRRGAQGWDHHRWHICVRSQAHQLPLTGCQQPDIPLDTESDNAESKPSPSGDFKASTSCPMLSLWWAAGSVRCSEKAPAPLGSVAALARDLLDALGKAN